MLTKDRTVGITNDTNCLALFKKRNQDMEFKHKPVLLKECIEGLNIKSDGIYVDGFICSNRVTWSL